MHSEHLMQHASAFDAYNMINISYKESHLLHTARDFTILSKTSQA